MLANWVVGISLIATSNISRVAAEASRSTAAAQKSVTGLKSSVSGLANVAKVVDRTLTTVGVGAAAAFAIGVKGAADLQNSITAIAIAMGRTTSFVDSNFTGIATKMSASTAQSVSQSMDILKTAALSGLSDPAQLKSLAMPLAQYADTQYLLKGTSFESSTATASKIAHEFGARSADDLNPILNDLFKISNDMPDSISNMATQLKYYAPKFAEVGVSPTEILKLSATADRLGYGTGKSGTGFYQIYRNLLNPTKEEGIAQHKLGIDTIIGKNGRFDPEQLFGRLHTLYDQSRVGGVNSTQAKAFDQLLNRAFSSNAGLIAGVMSSDAGRKQYAAVGQTMARVEDMDKAQAQAMNTLTNQTKLLTTNFQTLTTFIAKPWMQAFTSAVGRMADVLGKWASWMEAHQDTAKIVGGAMMGLGAYGIARVAMSTGNFLHAFAVIGKHPHFGVAASHLGEEGAHAAARRGWLGAAVGGGEGLLGDLFGFSEIRKLLGAGAGKIGEGASFLGGKVGLPGMLANVGEFFTHFGATLRPLAAPLEMVAEGFGKLGIRFIPFVGEVMLAFDALNFLGHHMKDIGYFAGVAIAWLGDNLPGMIRGLTGLAVAGMKGLVTEIIGVLDPRNWVKAITDFKNGVMDGIRDSKALHLNDKQKKVLQMRDPSLVLDPNKGAPITVNHHYTVNVTASSQKDGFLAGQAFLSVVNRSTSNTLGPTLFAHPVPARR